MKNKFKFFALSATLIFGSVLTVFSQNIEVDTWAQFRGSDGDGTSTENISESDWIQSPPELIWKKEIGSGFSELVLSGGIIYTMISEKTDSITGFEYIAAFDEANGDLLWRSKVDSIFIDVDGWGDGPRSTPIVDAENIFSLSANGKFSAHSIKKGDLLWQIDFVAEFGSTRPRWGFSSSPLLLDDKLIIEVGGTEERAFMAFNKENGKTLWESSKGNASYSSGVVVNIDQQEQLVFANGRKLYSFNSEGDTLWTYNMPFGNITALPVFIAPNKLFVSGVRTPGFFIVEVENNKATEFISASSMKNDYNSSVYHEGFIYGFHVAAVRCISAETGEVKWTKRGYGKGSLILVGNKLLVLSDKGKLILVDTNPEVYTEKGFVQPISGKSWTAPSFLGGKVYVRNLTEMACYKVK